MMKKNFFYYVLSFIFLHCAWPKEEGLQKEIFQKAFKVYKEGKYLDTVKELQDVLNHHQKDLDEKNKSMIYYWMGLCYNKSFYFSDAEKHLKKSLRLKNNFKDLFYELAQSLFRAEKLEEAKIYFSESFKNSFKRATSLYYIAYISQEMRDLENAKNIYHAILKQPKNVPLVVKQASMMKLADISFEEAKKSPHIFKKITNTIIPMYEKAIDIDPGSSLSKRIKKQIYNLKLEYELVLLKLRNGRPTKNPPYLLKVGEELGFDSNVTFSPQETTISKSRQGSTYSQFDLLGRYTFYHKNFFSYSPELRFVHSYYFNRVPEIYRNDNYLVAPSLKTSYEHTLNNRQASLMLDYSFNYSQRDVRAKKKLEFSSRSHVISLSERFFWLKNGESTVSLSKRFFESFLKESNSESWSLLIEQNIQLEKQSLILSSIFDRARVKEKLFDTNSFSLRADVIFTHFSKLYTPSTGFSFKLTDPINNRDARGFEILLNPYIRVSRRFKKNWLLNVRYEYFRNISEDKLNFDYTKSLAGIDIEYLY